MEFGVDYEGIWDMVVHSSVCICVFGYDVVLCINVFMVC